MQLFFKGNLEKVVQVIDLGKISRRRRDDDRIPFFTRFQQYV